MLGPEDQKFIECPESQCGTGNLGYGGYLTAFILRPERFADIWI